MTNRGLTRREMLGLLGGGALLAAHTTSAGALAAPELSRSTEGLHYLTLRDVARLIERRELSPVELTRTMLTRIDALDPQLHSYQTVMREQALAAARTAEREILAGNYRGPLHGIPIAVKDLCFTKGVATMGGLAFKRDFVPSFDATVVSRLEQAGAVLLGKLSLTEGAMAGYHRSFDIPVNPWGRAWWTGVSSSGSGVATAAGLCFASLGTDTGGSIRFPAMANGIVGLKPTYGRVSRYGVLPLAESLDHVGPMTRSVADAAIMLEAIAGFDPNDATSLRAPVPQMRDALGRGVSGLRIGFDRAYALDGVDPGLARSIEVAVDELRRLGAEIVEVQVPDVSEALAAWPLLCAAEAAHAHREDYPSRASEYGEYFREFLAMGAAVDGTTLANARAVRQAFGERFRSMLATVDTVLSPAAGAPYELDTALQYQSMTAWNAARVRRLAGAKLDTSFTFPHDLAGTPTLALPCGVSAAGLPYTMQLAGGPLSEAMLCQIGQAYEDATRWHTLRPPV
jgi:amidase